MILTLFISFDCVCFEPRTGIALPGGILGLAPVRAHSSKLFRSPLEAAHVFCSCRHTQDAPDLHSKPAVISHSFFQTNDPSPANRTFLSAPSHRSGGMLLRKCRSRKEIRAYLSLAAHRPRSSYPCSAALLSASDAAADQFGRAHRSGRGHTDTQDIGQPALTESTSS